MQDSSTSTVQGPAGVLSNWTNGGNNNFGIRGTAPREKPELERDSEPELAERPAQYQGRLLVHFCKRVQLNTFQTYTFSDEQTRNPGVNNTGLSLASALLGFPNSFTAQLPILHGGR